MFEKFKLYSCEEGYKISIVNVIVLFYAKSTINVDRHAIF